jgi:hypothetical protein
MAHNCPTQIFSVTPGQYDGICAQLAADGVQLTGDAGIAVSQGITISYHFDRPNSKLTLSVTDKPFLVPCSAIFSKVTDAIR